MRLRLAIALAFLSSIPSAYGLTIDPNEPMSAELCKAYADFNRVAMEARQRDVELLTLMKRLEESQGTSGIDKTLRKVVFDAYSQPSYPTIKLKAIAIISYGEGKYEDCMENGLPDAPEPFSNYLNQ